MGLCMRYVIFTDLDGTLLDHDTYSYKAAKDALSLIKRKKVPLVICSSKTRAEIEYYRKKLRNKDPFISENGGAIFIPKKYFDFKFKYDKKIKEYFIIKLGADYKKLIGVLKKIKKKYKVKGFNDMTVKEVAKDTGLSLKEARLAKIREFDEAFRVLNKKNEREILKLIKKNNLNYTKGGRYYHIMGKSDKGKAVKILTRLFRKKFGRIKTIGLGDSRNDFEMLDKTDVRYLVQRGNRSYASEKYKKARGIGPVGWNKAVKGVLE